MNNSIGALQETVVSFRKRLLYLETSYLPIQTDDNRFVCTLTLRSQSGFTVPAELQEINLEVKSEPLPKKKAAEQQAAHMMLQSELFCRLETFVKTGVMSTPSLKPATVENTTTTTSSSTNTLFVTSAATPVELSLTTSNPRGCLNEYTQKYPNLKIEFSTTSVAPFVGEVRAHVVPSGIVAPIVVHSAPQSTKQKANYDASHRMLTHPGFSILLSAAQGHTFLSSSVGQPLVLSHVEQPRVEPARVSSPVSVSATAALSPACVRTEPVCANPKGRLMEYTQKYTHLKIEFSTTSVAPFVGEVKAYVVSSSTDPIVVRSGPHSTKQQANFEASQRMLTHPDFSYLLCAASHGTFRPPAAVFDLLQRKRPAEEMSGPPVESDKPEKHSIRVGTLLPRRQNALMFDEYEWF